MAKKELTIKRGDTFLVVCTYTDPTNTPIDITSIDIKSQIRNTRGDIVSELQVIKEAQTGATIGKFTLRSATDTWPIGEHQWDIQYTDSGNIQSTDTLTVIVNQDITRE